MNNDLERFLELCGEDQEDIIFKDGTRLAARTFEKYSIALWQVKSFYAEIWYNEDDYPEKVKAFDDVTLLDDYLDKINIEGL